MVSWSTSANRVYDRVVFVTGLVSWNGTLPLPKTAAACIVPAEKQLYPDGWSGYGGVGRNGSQAPSAVVRGLPSRSASWMAVIVRQKLWWALSSQQLISAWRRRHPCARSRMQSAARPSRIAGNGETRRDGPVQSA
jgi:hypothetical protein